MVIKFYQFDAFTNTLFGGNPAAIYLLDKRLTNHSILQRTGLVKDEIYFAEQTI